MRFHIVKRDHCPLWKKLCLYLLAVGDSVAESALMLLGGVVAKLSDYSR